MSTPIKDDPPPEGEKCDEKYMGRCLELAREAAGRGEVPVGALVLRDGQILGEGSNRSVEHRSPLRHAEMIALDAAFETAGEGRIPGAWLYCSLEPCFMCTGALLHARVARVVFAAHDPKFGACGSLAMLPQDPRLNHRCPVVSGVCADQSAQLLRDFFQSLR